MNHHRYFKYTQGLGLIFFTVWGNSSFAADTAQHALPHISADAPLFSAQKTLDYLPKAIDATPTLLPAQSDHAIVPSTEQTENSTWIDRKQQNIRQWADRTSGKIDQWFGETNPKDPASATLRLILDNEWDEHTGYEIKPRIRGKINLPTLEHKFSVVFGDDSLDDEIRDSAVITNSNPANTEDKKLDTKRTREDNSSLALRWSNMSKKLPFETDADLGIRSGNDIYLRLKAAKEWKIPNDFSFLAEQIYRYGSDSENYFRTNLELTHARPEQAFFANQLNLVVADAQDDDLIWENRTFREHQFFKGNRFNYGLYTGGQYDDNKLRLNSWGPFVSWRQPLWREWFFVQGDLHYLNDDREDYSHYVQTALRLEALF